MDTEFRCPWKHRVYSVFTVALINEHRVYDHWVINPKVRHLYIDRNKQYAVRCINQCKGISINLTHLKKMFRIIYLQTYPWKIVLVKDKFRYIKLSISICHETIFCKILIHLAKVYYYFGPLTPKIVDQLINKSIPLSRQY